MHAPNAGNDSTSENPFPPDIALLWDAESLAGEFIRMSERRSVPVRRFERSADLVTHCARSRRRTLVVMGIGAASCLEELQLPSERLQVVLVSRRRAETSADRELAGRLGAKVVCAGRRLIPRLVEVVEQLMGRKLRRNFRRDAQETATLGIVGAPADQELSVCVENVSESGVKICAHAQVYPGSECTFRCPSRLGDLALRAEVVRVRRSRSETDVWQAGLRFLNVGPEEAHRLMLWVGDTERELAKDLAKTRAAPRLQPAKRLLVKARLNVVGEKRRHYLPVVDISEGGFRAGPAASVDWGVGQWVDVQLLWRGSSFRATGELVARNYRREQGRIEWFYGFKFVKVDRAIQRELGALLHQVGAAGRSGSAQADAEEAGALSFANEPPTQ